MALVRTVLFYLFNILTVTPWSFIVVASRLFPVHTRYKLCTPVSYTHLTLPTNREV